MFEVFHLAKIVIFQNEKYFLIIYTARNFETEYILRSYAFCSFLVFIGLITVISFAYIFNLCLILFVLILSIITYQIKSIGLLYCKCLFLFYICHVPAFRLTLVYFIYFCRQISAVDVSFLLMTSSIFGRQSILMSAVCSHQTRTGFTFNKS
jgi:hypothetical protein